MSNPSPVEPLAPRQAANPDVSPSVQNSAAAPATDPLLSNSSIFAKVSPDLRRRVNRALIDRDPPTYRDVFDQFDLARLGVSYTAFYYYARRVRVQAAAINARNAHAQCGTATSLPPESDVARMLADSLSVRLLETLTDDEADPRILHRLVDAWRITHRVRLDDAAYRRKVLDETAHQHLAQARAIREAVLALIGDVRAAHHPPPAPSPDNVP